MGGGAATYDAKGNLLTEGGRTLAYDSENKLTGATTPQAFSILYDPPGRFRGFAAGATTAAFDMVGTDIVAARVNGGATSERYVFGPRMDEPMVGFDNAGARYYFHADERGSIVATSDAAGSAAGKTIGYDEYGKPSAFNSRFLYAGKMHLGGVNSYYSNARFYDYTLGRFLQPDPIGYGAGMNLYAYVGGDPVNFTDPLGLTPTQRICTGTKICPQHDSGGSGGSGSGMLGAPGVSYGGHFQRAGPGGPAQGTSESIEITSAFVWVRDSFGFFDIDFMRDVVAPVAERTFERFKKGVNDARCQVGQAGILVDETGRQVSNAGLRIVGVGAAIGVGGAVTAQPEVAAVGVAVADQGALIMLAGGGASLIGAGMRAIGGDYSAFVGRGAVRTAGRAIPNPAVRAVSTNMANRAASPSGKRIPTCG